jgi:hypothetical protein
VDNSLRAEIEEVLGLGSFDAISKEPPLDERHSAEEDKLNVQEFPRMSWTTRMMQKWRMPSL